MEQQIYVITGMMASGKSTVADLLASRLEKCVHLRGDIFRRMIVSGRAEMSETPSEEAVCQLHLRYELTAEAAKRYVQHGFSVVIQDNYYGKDLNCILSLLAGYPVKPVVLCPRANVIAERETSRGKRGYVGFTVEGLYDAFLRETPRIGLWLDTSDQSPEQSVDAILRHYGEQEKT